MAMDDFIVALERSYALARAARVAWVEVAWVEENEARAFNLVWDAWSLMWTAVRERAERDNEACRRLAER